MAGLTFGVALDFGSKARSLQAQLDRQSALLEPAERAGFEIVAAGESASPGGFHLPNAIVVLATLAQRTSLRLCTGIALLPAWPVKRLALDAAELDQLSGGRMILGTGLGSPGLQRLGGWPGDAIGETADQTLQALRSLWSGEAEYVGTRVAVHGGLAVVPVNGARLPIWVGGAIRRSAVRAARLGDGWYGGVNFLLSRLAGQAAVYRAAGGSGAVVVNRVTLVGDTPRRMDELAERHLVGTIRPYAESLQQAMAEVALVGTPEQVVAQLQRYQAAGATHVFTRLSLEDMPPEVVLGTIELMGREVIPRLR
jgi:alkanesulfonate monooxygenase SsuD/methylene tetrahydromethanopterin reductase-like flavin-dependent oxidoreductase (luciferase family)